MTKRATKRPKEFRKPAHWEDAPVPKAKAGKDAKDDPETLSPTRYGDWTKNGIAIDF
jgi:hypothetical protein